MALDAENLTEGQNETEENLNPELEESTEQVDEGEGEESTTPETSEESPTSKLDSRLAALEDQLRRSNEDRETLRETLRLNQQLVENTRPAKPVKTLTEEQKALKDLGLTFGDDVKDAMEPLVGTVTKLFDSNDAVQFQLQLSRTDPKLLEGEAFDKLSQTVEAVRQQYARATGQWLGRLDAYKYAKGSGMLDTIVTPVTGKAGTNDAEEVKRVAATKAAGTIKSTSNQVTNQGDADIQKIRAKATRGERLTAQERAKFREFLGDKPF